jgi:hypothetical protein
MRIWIALAVVVGLVAPVTAQGLPQTGSLDRFMKESGAQQSQKELQQIVGRKRTRGTARKPPKAGKHAPAGATDFQQSGSRPYVETFLQSVNVDANAKTHLRAVFEAAFESVNKALRPNNVAAAMGYALGVAIQIVNDVELPDADAKELVTGINDMLAASQEFKGLGQAERQVLYEGFVMTGAMLMIAHNAGKNDPSIRQQSQDMARNVISQLSGQVAR